MENREEKRARIIAAQAAREAADQAAGKVPPLAKPRANWAASPPMTNLRRFRRRKPVE